MPVGGRFAWLSRWIRGLRTDVVVAAATSAVLGFLLGWAVTAPTWSMGVNGDTAGYASEIARGSPWARTPWNSHYGVGQVYWLAAHMAQPLGLTVLGCLRALNAFALAASGLVIAVCSIRLRLRPIVAVLLSAIYLTAWGTLILAFTWEDNILFHPAALATLALCLVSIDRWNWRISLAAGSLAGLASLMSWQGASYSLPAVYVAVLLGSGQRRWWQRLHDGALVPVGLVTARFAWVAAYWVTARPLAFSDLLKTAFERPSPNFLPKDFAGWVALPVRWREILAHLGLGIAHELGPDVRDWVARSFARQMTVGATFIGIVVLSWLVVGIVLRRRLSRRTKFIVASLVLLTSSAAVYLDLPGDKYMRYDYLPMLLCLGLVVVGAWVRESVASFRWHRQVFLCSLLALNAGQVALAYHANRQWHDRLTTTPAGRRIGNGGQTWYSVVRSLRRAAPESCSFIFTFDEVAAAKDNIEVLASLFSELPDPQVIGAPPSAKTWPRTLPLASPAELAARWRGCEWVSAAARSQLPIR
jgi:hypothetical protein